ncbi:hypothetical protein Pla52o_39210 [Novipirellula galeiformis]|uniref:Uncharacterized protein n=1 Tax=Novipirellula galeiformis TaxID=2528004 RepID=A0A5C6CE08_9BACT|nr:hypothetical protein Pla52o_39210 [Novipirellula galeiformis]
MVANVRLLSQPETSQPVCYLQRQYRSLLCYGYFWFHRNRSLSAPIASQCTLKALLKPSFSHFLKQMPFAAIFQYSQSRFDLADLFLSGSSLGSGGGHSVAVFVFPLLWIRCAALATGADGTTQSPLPRKHIQRCSGVISRIVFRRGKRWANVRGRPIETPAIRPWKSDVADSLRRLVGWLAERPNSREER